MSEVLRKIERVLMDKAVGTGVGALGLVTEEELFENIAAYHKALGTLRQAHKGVVAAGLGLAGIIIDIKGVDDALSVGLAEMLYGGYEALVKKKPFCKANSGTEIECWGLDANATISSIKVDGNDVTVSATTDANGYVKITLSSALSSGKHDLVVVTGKKAFYGVIVV